MATATEAYGNIYSGGITAVGADGSSTYCRSTCGCSGDRHPCLPRCVVEGCGGSARVVSGRGIGDGTVFPTASVGGGGQGARFHRWNSGIDSGPGDRRYCSLRCFSWGGARAVSCSSGIGGNIGGGTVDQRYRSLGRIN